MNISNRQRKIAAAGTAALTCLVILLLLGLETPYVDFYGKNWPLLMYGIPILTMTFNQDSPFLSIIISIVIMIFRCKYTVMPIVAFVGGTIAKLMMPQAEAIINEPERTKGKPSTRFLIMVNLLVWCVIFCYWSLSPTVSSYITGKELTRAKSDIQLTLGHLVFPMSVILLTTFGQLMLHFKVRKKNLKPCIRILLFAAPALLLALIVNVALTFLGTSVKPMAPGRALTGTSHNNRAAISQTIYR